MWCISKLLGLGDGDLFMDTLLSILGDSPLVISATAASWDLGSPVSIVGFVFFCTASCESVSGTVLAVRTFGA